MFRLGPEGVVWRGREIGGDGGLGQAWNEAGTIEGKGYGACGRRGRGRDDDEYDEMQEMAPSDGRGCPRAGCGEPRLGIGWEQ